MKIKYKLFVILLLLFSAGFSQEKNRFPLLFSVSNNATLIPFTGYLGVFTSPVHPGFSAGTLIPLKNRERSSFLETFRIGGFYHKYSEFTVQLYSELIYQYRFGKFAIEPQLQAGYMLAFTDLQVFELQGDEYKEKTFKGRSQFTAGAGFGISYLVNTESGNPVKLMLGYLVNLQMPFIKNYSPVLIISSLQAGVMFYVPFDKNNGN